MLGLSPLVLRHRAVASGSMNDEHQDPFLLAVAVGGATLLALLAVLAVVVVLVARW